MAKENVVNRINDYYSTTKRNEVFIYAVIQTSLENSMLNERSQTQKSHVIGFQLHETFIIGKSIQTESRSVFASGRRGVEITIKESRASF